MGAASRPAAKRADARRNSERLIAAAAAAFAERGADDVSLEEIARRAGVGIGTLYRNFPARQALLEAVYQDQVDGLDAKAAKLAAAESPGAALAQWLRAFMAFGQAKRSLSAALVAADGTNAEFLSSCRQTLWARTDELLRRAQDAGEVRKELQAADILRLAHSLMMTRDPGPADTDQDERLLSLVITGMLSPDAGGAAS